MRSRRLPRFSPGSACGRSRIAQPRHLEVSQAPSGALWNSNSREERILGRPSQRLIILGSPGQSRNSLRRRG